MILEDENAFVIENYDLTFANGTSMNGNVAEVWTERKTHLTEDIF